MCQSVGGLKRHNEKKRQQKCMYVCEFCVSLSSLKNHSHLKHKPSLTDYLVIVIDNEVEPYVYFFYWSLSIREKVWNNSFFIFTKFYISDARFTSLVMELSNIIFITKMSSEKFESFEDDLNSVLDSLKEAIDDRILKCSGGKQH